MRIKLDKRLNYGRSQIKSFYASIPKINNALDVGAGNGIDLENLKKIHPECNLNAVENYQPYCEVLESKNIKTVNINFENSALPFVQENFDLIISNQTLEHTKEIFWVLHEMSRTLKVGGYLIIGVPNLASLHNRILLLLGRQPTSIQNHSAHIRGYTKSDVLKVLSIFVDGYELIDFKGGNFYPFPPFMAKILEKLLPSMAWANFFLLKKIKDYEDNSFLKYPIEQKLETAFFLGKN
jgi:ubiquinone/menaquinone biosynthesis C-methylase UbiE